MSRASRSPRSEKRKSSKLREGVLGQSDKGTRKKTCHETTHAVRTGRGKEPGLKKSPVPWNSVPTSMLGGFNLKRGHQRTIESTEENQDNVGKNEGAFLLWLSSKKEAAAVPEGKGSGGPCLGKPRNQGGRYSIWGGGLQWALLREKAPAGGPTESEKRRTPPDEGWTRQESTPSSKKKKPAARIKCSKPKKRKRGGTTCQGQSQTDWPGKRPLRTAHVEENRSGRETCMGGT